MTGSSEYVAVPAAETQPREPSAAVTPQEQPTATSPVDSNLSHKVKAGLSDLVHPTELPTVVDAPEESTTSLPISSIYTTSSTQPIADSTIPHKTGTSKPYDPNHQNVFEKVLSFVFDGPKGSRSAREAKELREWEAQDRDETVERTPEQERERQRRMQKRRDIRMGGDGLRENDLAKGGPGSAGLGLISG